MLNLTNFQKAGYGAVFVETTEMKRAIRSIEIDKPFKTKLWSPIRGLINSRTANRWIICCCSPKHRFYNGIL